MLRGSEAGEEVGAGHNIHSRESEEFLATLRLPSCRTVRNFRTVASFLQLSLPL